MKRFKNGSLKYSTFSVVPISVSALIVIVAAWRLFRWAIWNIAMLPFVSLAIIALYAILTKALTFALRALLCGKSEKESGEISRRFNETKDAPEYYNALANMKNPPVFAEDMNYHCISLAKALLLQGRREEALQALDDIPVVCEEYKPKIEKLREDILQEGVDKAENMPDASGDK